MRRQQSRVICLTAIVFAIVAMSALPVWAQTTFDWINASGGVFQNELLLIDLKYLMEGLHIEVWMNRSVPPNDGGISLGQAAIAAFQYLSDSRQHHA